MTSKTAKPPKDAAPETRPLPQKGGSYLRDGETLKQQAGTIWPNPKNGS